MKTHFSIRKTRTRRNLSLQFFSFFFLVNTATTDLFFIIKCIHQKVRSFKNYLHTKFVLIDRIKKEKKMNSKIMNIKDRKLCRKVHEEIKEKLIEAQRGDKGIFRELEE